MNGVAMHVRSRFLSILGPLFGLSLFLAALWVLHRATVAYHYRDIAAAVWSVPRGRLAAALLLTFLNYIVLTGYDALAFRYIGRSLAYRRIAFASFIGYAFSNSIGLSMLAGSAVRYRLYTVWGISTIEITRMVAFYTLTLWLGLFALSGLAFTIEPIALPSALHLPFHSLRPLGEAFLAVLCSYMLVTVLRKKPVVVLHYEIALPAPGLSLAQIAVASVDWVLACSVLYVLLPASAPDLPAFVGVFLLAQVAGLMSQVPGGLGVFESVLLVLLAPSVPAPQAIGALIVYRVVYYLLPLCLAAVLLGSFEMLRARTHAALVLRYIGQAIPAVAPPVLGALIFLTGALLLFSGATPGVPERLAWLKHQLPLSLLEISHFFGSLVGSALLLLAWGIRRRLDAAYHLAAVLLGVGIFFSLARGLDYEEAAVLAVMLSALLLSRRFFYRPASLLEERFSPAWIAAIVAVIVGSVWLGLFAYRHVSYSQDLWWQFTLHGDAPRFLRATVGAVALTVLVGILRLLRLAPPEPSASTDMDLARALPVIERSGDTTAHLALLGDKLLLFSDTGRSFVMYGIEGRSWIAMGDPVGEERERRELVWRFRELSDRHGGWPVFYEAGTENLPLYLDLGLTPIKIGEEAVVPLADFSLEGSQRKGLRYTHARMEREGASFAVVPKSGVVDLLPELRAISDEWIAEKNTREKRFSLGSFTEAYIARCPVAVVRREGRIIAFANLWPGDGRVELSIDLMRQRADAQRGVMEYLFLSLMLWGREQGYGRFNLGMVPLAGLEDRTLAPLWNRLGAQVFRHGEHFYNFQGLRQFKEHFAPLWSPKYLITPGGFILPRVLMNLASLISGGVKGMVAK
jgi:phosphatidylglycerol lysyltransferase